MADDNDINDLRTGNVELHPQRIASTRDDFDTPVLQKASLRPPGSSKKRSKFFRKALFSADGTSIITHNDDNSLRTFVLPTDLLEGADHAKHLTPLDGFQAGSNIQSYAIYPGFNLTDTSSTVILCGQVDVPITLRSALLYEPIVASYPSVNPLTEAHRTPRSLAFSRDGQHFLAGSDNLLAAFDCTRSGKGPFLEHKLSFGRNAPRQHNVGQLKRGAPTTLAISQDGTLALGTDQREVSLYAQDGLGAWITSFELEKGLGSGVSDVKWSPCGRYLLVSERQSNVIQVYDIRNKQQKVSDLTGRYAATPQAMYMDIIQTASGYEVWAGGTDGTVRMWTNPGSKEDDQMPDASLELHAAPIPSALWHPSGAVLATASGKRLEAGDIEAGSEDEGDVEKDEEEGEDDRGVGRDGTSYKYVANSLSIWTL